MSLAKSFDQLPGVSEIFLLTLTRRPILRFAIGSVNLGVIVNSEDVLNWASWAKGQTTTFQSLKMLTYTLKTIFSNNELSPHGFSSVVLTMLLIAFLEVSTCQTSCFICPVHTSVQSKEMAFFELGICTQMARFFEWIAEYPFATRTLTVNSSFGALYIPRSHPGYPLSITLPTNPGK